MTIEKAGEFGAPIIKNLGYNANLLQAMRDAMYERSYLWNDEVVLESKLVQGTRTIFPRDEGCLYTATMKGTWNIYYNEKFWGRVTFSCYSDKN